MTDTSKKQDDQNNKRLDINIHSLPDDALQELHRIARYYMSKERSSHTLQATALVNEAYISLHSAEVETNDKLHFFALAAKHMRRILVDHARKKNAKKREANVLAITASDELVFGPENTTALVLLDEILTQFFNLDERAANMYEMKLFAGLTNLELANVFGLSEATVERDLRIAKAWINAQYE